MLPKQDTCKFQFFAYVAHQILYLHCASRDVPLLLLRGSVAEPGG